MAKQLQLRRGSSAEHNTFTGAVGEVTVDTTNKTLRVHDGVTVGGTMLVTYTAPPALPGATTSTEGVVKLNNTLTSTSTTEALTANQGRVLYNRDFGFDQYWQNVTAFRASGVTYTNSTARPILVSISLSDTFSQSPTVSIYVGGVLILTNNYDDDSNFGSFSHSFIVPSGSTYSISSPLSTIKTWSELR